MSVDKTRAVGEVHDATEREADIRYWTKVCRPPIESLLRAAGSYSEADINVQLQTLSELIIPLLGPRPCRAPAPSAMTHTGCPLQPSINLTSKINRVRYGIEVLGDTGGKSRGDPLAVQIAKDTVAKLSARFGYSTKWSDVLFSAFGPTPEEARQVLDMVPEYYRNTVPEAVVAPPPEMLIFGMMAFDLKGPEISAKLYVNLKPKEILTGVSVGDLLWDTLRRMTPAFKPEAIDMMEKFFDDNSDPLPLHIVAVDCVDEAHLSEARVKIYYHSMSNSFRTVQRHITLGGKVQDEERLKGLEMLRSIWHLFVQRPEGIPDDDFETARKDSSILPHKLYFCLELRPGDDVPIVKAHLPVWNYIGSDEEAIRNYEANFRMVQHPWGEAGTYGKVFRDAFGPPTHDGEKTIHGYSSFVYTEETGVYQTSYYSPLLAEED
uniref:Aromatic prenyl transferase n=1 Tax=Aciculosporium take TaxID=42363 RepID=J7FIR0_9HYPO|nr:aromatic prenyl transferase [Aciculosporium take]